MGSIYLGVRGKHHIMITQPLTYSSLNKMLNFSKLLTNQHYLVTPV